MSQQGIIDFINENIEKRVGHSTAFVCEGTSGARISIHEDLGGAMILAITDPNSLEKSQVWLLEPVTVEQPTEDELSPSAIFCNGQVYCSLCPRHGQKNCHVRSHPDQGQQQ